VIYLSNNGFKVINIGIKMNGAISGGVSKGGSSAIGMSGLLVKSTAVMRDNLQAMAEMGITIPVMLGGAALTRSFVA